MGDDAAPDVDQPRFPRYEAWRDRVRSRRSLDVTWRIVVTVVGALVIVAGIGMLVLPGPGWAAIFIGLAILGSEYDWASRALHAVRDKVVAMTEKASDPRVRRRNQIILVVGGCTVVAGCVWYLESQGVPDLVASFLPSSWIPDRWE